MNKFWKLATCALLVFSISMVIGSNNLSNQIEELQTTVDRLNMWFKDASLKVKEL